MRVNPKIRKAIEETGLPFRLEEGGRHIKIVLHDKLVTTVSRRSTEGSGRAIKNIVASIRREAMAINKPPAVYVQKIHLQSTRGEGFSACRPDLKNVSTTTDPAEVTCRNCEIRDTIERRMEMVKLASVPPSNPAASDQDFCLVSYTKGGQLMIYLPGNLIPDRNAGYSISTDLGDPSAVVFHLSPAEDEKRRPHFQTAKGDGRAKGMACVTFQRSSAPGASLISHFGMTDAAAHREGDHVVIRVEVKDMRPPVIKGSLRRQMEAMTAAPALPVPEPEPALSHTPVMGVPTLQMFKDAVLAVNAYVNSPEGQNVRLDISSNGTLRASIAEVIE